MEVMSIYRTIRRRWDHLTHFCVIKNKRKARLERAIAKQRNNDLKVDWPREK